MESQDRELLKIMQMKKSLNQNIQLNNAFMLSKLSVLLHLKLQQEKKD